MTKPLLMIATLLLTATTAAPAGVFDLNWFSIDAGGGSSVSGALVLSGTIGQHDVHPDSPSSAGGGYQLTGGFWAMPAPTPPTPCGDFDQDGDIDLSDFAVFSQCFGGALLPPAPACPNGVDADCDEDGDVDLADFAVFSQNFTGPQ